MAELFENILNPGLEFNVLLGKTKDFMHGELSEENFSNWGDKFVIRTSIPIIQKTLIIMNITKNYYYNYSNKIQEELTQQLYIDLFFDGYLGGYLGINDIQDFQKNAENYDILEPIFGTWIEQTAGRDIRLFKEMLFNNIQSYNIKEISDALSEIDPEKLEEQTKANEELVKFLSKKTTVVDKINKIAEFNNPELMQLIDTIKSEAAKEAKEK